MAAGFLDTQSPANQVEAIYIAYFSRAADGPGYLFWTQQYSAAILAGQPATTAANNIANSFAPQPEAKAQYSFLASPPQQINSNDPVQQAAVNTLVETVYQNLFNRPADQAGLTYWSTQILTQQVAIGTAIYAIADGALGNDATALGLKIKAAQDFTTLTYQNNLGVVIPPATALSSTFLSAAHNSVVSVVDAATEAASETATLAFVTPSSSTATLTTGIDNVTANNIFGSDTQFLTDGHGPTVNPGDVLNGVFGATNNTFTVTDLTPGAAIDLIPSGVTLANIQNVILNSSGNTAVSGFNTIPYTSVNNLSVTTAGIFGDVVQAGNGNNGTTATTVTINHSSTLGGGVTELGGKDVSITTNGLSGAVLVGLSALGGLPPAADLVTGAITVTSGDTGGAGGIFVVGGSSVTITATAASFAGGINVGNTGFNTGNSAFGAAANTVGNITIKSAGAGPITAFGGAVVTVNSAGGVVTVGDATGTIPSNEATGLITVTNAAPVAYDGLSTAGLNYLTVGGLVLAAGTAIGGSHNAFNNGVFVFGGGAAGATVTTNAGSVVVGTANAVAGTNTTGNITVTDTANDQTDAVNAAVAVFGGANVTVSATDDNVTVGSATKASADATGTVAVTETSATTMQDVNGTTLGVAPPALTTHVFNPHVVTIDGGNGVTVTALGQNVVVGANLGTAGAQVVTQTAVLTGAGMAQGAGAVTVDGGSTVTVTTTGGNVTVGSVNFQPTGAVLVTDNFGSGNATADNIIDLGGTTVGITVASADTGTISVGSTGGFAGVPNVILNAAKTAVANTSLDPTGNVTIVNDQVNGTTTTYGTGATFVDTNGSATVSITGGSVNGVVDVESSVGQGNTAVGKSALATVTLIGSQSGATLIQTDALSALTIQNSVAAVYTVTDNTSGYTLGLTLGGDNKAIQIIDAPTTGTGAGAITIGDNGTASTGIVTLTAAKAATLAVNTTAAASLNLAGDTSLTTITAANKGSLALGDLRGLAKLANVNAQTATGSISALINDNNGTGGTSFNGAGSTGTETVGITSNTLGTGVSIVAGSPTTGANTLQILYNAAANDVPISGKVTGFSNMALGLTAATAVNSDTHGGVYQPTVTAVAQTDTITVNAAAAGDTYNVFFNGTLVATKAFAAGDTTQTIALSLAGQVFGSPAATNVSVSTATAGSFTITSTKAGTGFTITTTGSTPAADITDVTTTPNQIAVTGDAAFDASGFKALTVGAANGDVTFLNVASGTSLTIGVPADVVGAAAAASSLFPAGLPNVVNYVMTKTTAASVVPLQVGVDGTASVLSGGSVVTTPGTGTTGNTALAPVIVSVPGVPAVGAVAAGAPQVTISSQGEVKSAQGASQTNFVVLGDTAVVKIVVTGDQNLALAVDQSNLSLSTGLTSSLAVVDASGSTGSVNLTAVPGAPLMTGIVLAESATAKTGVGHTITGGGGALTAGGGASPFDTDTFNVGSGGGTITLGSGGKWLPTVPAPVPPSGAYQTGFEAVNLATAAGTKATTIVVNDGAVSTQATQGGVTVGGVSNFIEAVTAPDVLSFVNAPKTLPGNVGKVTQLSSLAGYNTLLGALGISAGTTSANNLQNLSYTMFDGSIQWSTAAGGTLLGNYPPQDLVSAAEIILNSTGGSLVAAFTQNGNTFVVSDDAAQTLLTSGTGANKDSVVELVGDGTANGFGSTGAAGDITVKSVVFPDVTPALAPGGNTGASLAAQVYNGLGYTQATISAAAGFIPVQASAASLHGTQSYTVNGLAGAAIINIDSGNNATPHVGDLIVTQSGTSGAESLTVNVGSAAFTTIVDSLTFSGDTAVTLNSAAFGSGVTSLIDAANTMTGLTIGGAGSFALDGVTSTSLATVTITDTGAVTLFDTAAMSNVLTFNDTGATGGGGAVTIGGHFAVGLGPTTFGLTGNGDTITIGSASVNNNSASSLLVSGSGATITIDGTGNNVINATNSNDKITVGDTVNGIGSDTIHATGATETVTLLGTTLSGGPGVSVTVGNGATVNLSSTAAHPLNETVTITGDTAGGTSAAFLQTTLNHAADNAGQAVAFGNSASNGLALNEVLAGNSVAHSMVNVEGLTSLATALDAAASQAATALNPNPNFTSFNQINAATGVIDWFQFQGNTYIVEAVNGGTAPAPHAALAAGDTVVELTGLVNIGAHGAFAAGVLTL